MIFLPSFLTVLKAFFVEADTPKVIKRKEKRFKPTHFKKKSEKLKRKIIYPKNNLKALISINF